MKNLSLSTCWRCQDANVSEHDCPAGHPAHGKSTACTSAVATATNRLLPRFLANYLGPGSPPWLQPLWAAADPKLRAHVLPSVSPMTKCATLHMPQSVLCTGKVRAHSKWPIT